MRRDEGDGPGSEAAMRLLRGRGSQAAMRAMRVVRMELQGFVYILTNKNNTTLYTGVTRDLQRRLAEHKLHINKGFSDRYNTEKLVYFERYERLDAAIHREKQLKKWHRDWKEKLINDFNPEWKDLAEDIGVDEEYMKGVKERYEAERGGEIAAQRPR